MVNGSQKTVFYPSIPTSAFSKMQCRAALSIKTAQTVERCQQFRSRNVHANCLHTLIKLVQNNHSLLRDINVNCYDVCTDTFVKRLIAPHRRLIFVLMNNFVVCVTSILHTSNHYH